MSSTRIIDGRAYARIEFDHIQAGMTIYQMTGDCDPVVIGEAVSVERNPHHTMRVSLSTGAGLTRTGYLSRSLWRVVQLDPEQIRSHVDSVEFHGNSRTRTYHKIQLAHQLLQGTADETLIDLANNANGYMRQAARHTIVRRHVPRKSYGEMAANSEWFKCKCVCQEMLGGNPDAEKTKRYKDAFERGEIAAERSERLYAERMENCEHPHVPYHLGK